MATRAEVYAAIDGERNYQEWVWRQRCAKRGVPYTPDAETLVEDWLIFIKGHYNVAISQATHVAGGGDVLDTVRKLAGLCVACLEVHGGWQRQLIGTLCDFHSGRLSRDVVYDLIGCEREFQEGLPWNRTEGRSHGINGYLLLFDTYLKAAIGHSGWSGYDGSQEALKSIGKLASIAVHCMEDHGAPRRVIDEALYVKPKTKIMDLVEQARQKIWRKPWA
jgi:hypothetical protein